MKAALPVVVTASAIGLSALALTLVGSSSRRPRSLLSLSTADEEAVARMLASENPGGSDDLWTEQIWTQIRSSGTRSLWEQITGLSGYGIQIGKRPVSTDNQPTARSRAFAARFLVNPLASQLVGAKRFFEPDQQDKAFLIAQTARRKRSAGLPLTAQEVRLLGYESDASDIRRRWSAKRGRYVGTIDGVEFWT